MESLQLDLCDFASVMAAAEKYNLVESELHILINNAGVLGLPYLLQMAMMFNGV